MNQTFIFRSVLILGASVTFALVYPQGSSLQHSMTNEQKVSLQSLVGHRCTVALKNGETVKGVIWDFGSDSSA